MSQDIVRQSNSRQQNPTAEDLWSTGTPGLAPFQPHMNMGGGMATMGPPNEPRPVEMIHRSLRGRYKLAILLAAVGSVVGAAVGWKMNDRTYRATGIIRIQPTTITPNTMEMMPEYGRYMNSEAGSLKSHEIAERAMGKPAWTDVAGSKPLTVATKGAFLAKLRASYNPQSYDITLTYDDGNPKLALAAIQAILDAYADVRNAAQTGPRNLTVDYFENQRKQVEDDVVALKQKVSDLQRNALGDINQTSTAMQNELLRYTSALDTAQLTLKRMETFAAAAKQNPVPLDPRALAARNTDYARLADLRSQIATQLMNSQQIQGRGNPAVLKLQKNLETLDAKIAEIGEALSKEIYGFLPPLEGANAVAAGVAPAPIEVSEGTLAMQRQAVADLKEQVESFRGRTRDAKGQSVTLDEINDQIAAKQRSLTDIEGKLALAQARTITLNAPFKTMPDPSTVVAEDKRATMATFGFLVGASLPIAGLVALGLLDRKYRYSDETNASSITRGIPLLGILPNLPDRLSDPSQASVAAHCVHQIRTMLQLNAVRADGPTVLAVTSATSGDGKTSLSLALGLSFAASGSRTLLIDSDLIGGGLSNRLGIREPQGISEAIVARSGMEFVRDTDVADLSILPVGNGGPQNASAFSPQAVRRLLAEMRKHFDLILIDTGPVLGSIEATPVVASSDGVILTASRGQNRDLVEKAILQLRNAGARVVGFVFNRANAKDFERSISGISLRSVSRAQANPSTNVNGHGVNGQYQDDRLGPLVHSVRGTRDEN